MKAAYPQVKEKYLSEYCFSGTYIISLLKTGYEFSLETWQQIQFLGKVFTYAGAVCLASPVAPPIPYSNPLPAGVLAWCTHTPCFRPLALPQPIVCPLGSPWGSVASCPLFQIGSSDAGWTLGYMLNLTNMIPAEQPLMRPLSHAGYVGLMVLSSLVLVGALLLGWCIFRKPRCLRKGIV